jgi:hypothetical protein
MTVEPRKLSNQETIDLARASPLRSSDQELVDTVNAKRIKARALKPKWVDPKALERKQAWIDTIVRTDPTHAVTLIWNPEDGRLGLEQVRIDISRAHCRIDRALMKSNYNTLPVTKRTGYVGFIEHPETNTHAHFAWRVPVEHHACFEDVLKGWWDRLHPYGEAHVRAIHDAAGWASYISKDQWRTSHADDAALLLASHTISR